MRLLHRVSNIFRRAARSWRAVASVCLVTSYLVLTGEAIHCQYLSSEHGQHENSSSRTATHSTHCILANHGSATLPAIASVGVYSLPFLGSFQLIEPPLGGAAFAVSPPARAPPAV